ncbi:MAG: HAD family phosphatase [Erysipelotrichaceae bacterium]|nr:HAD family phosphatase [Erysipelotrichaceae bacterium]
MYRLIATDLDQTLLNVDHHVSQEDIDTIRHLKDVRFVPASGRDFRSLQGTLKEIGLYDQENSYVISYNGSIITENKGNRIIFSEYMCHEDLLRLLEIGKKENLCIHFYMSDDIYIWNIYEEETAYLKGHMAYREIDTLSADFFKDKQLIKVLFARDDMDYLMKLRKDLDLEEEYEISLSSSHYLEFNKKGVSKGQALKKLCEILEIDIRDSIAIGDSINDLTMLKMAGFSIAVANASEEIKKDCDAVLDADHNHSPITEIVRKYL